MLTLIGQKIPSKKKMPCSTMKIYDIILDLYPYVKCSVDSPSQYHYNIGSNSWFIYRMSRKKFMIAHAAFAPNPFWQSPKESRFVLPRIVLSLLARKMLVKEYNKVFCNSDFLFSKIAIVNVFMWHPVFLLGLFS